jgi:predicted secreted protein
MRYLGLVRFLCFSTALLTEAPMSIANTEQVEDQVSFQIEVGRDVENDLVTAVLSVTAEALKPAKLADNLNDTMSWALEQARANQNVKSRSGAYQTYPVYEDQKIVRWRGRQELQLESPDVDRLSALVGVLQSRMQMQSLQFSVSPDQRRRVEDELIGQALKAYQQRAEIIRDSLSAQGYRLLAVEIDSRGNDRPVPVRAEVMSASGRSSVSPPAMEQGTSRINVRVSGKVQLLRD